MWELFLGYGSLTWLTCVVTVNVEKRLGFRIWLGSCSDTERKEAANACLNICIPFFIVIVAIWQIGSENAYVGKDGDKIVICMQRSSEPSIVSFYHLLTAFSLQYGHLFALQF